MQAEKMRRLRRQRLHGQKRGKSLGLRVRLQLQDEKIATSDGLGSKKASADEMRKPFFCQKYVKAWVQTIIAGSCALR